MSSDDRVSIVALIVSLVALLVALGQLLQAYFATADGYRRCSESVTGPWHRTRKRRFIWSELRFETVFVTPEILLVDDDRMWTLAAERNSPDVYDLVKSPAQEGLEGKSNKIMTDSVHPLAPDVWSKCSEKTARLALQDYIVDLDNPIQEPSEDVLLVSWIHLLRALHFLYSSYHPGKCALCGGQKNSAGNPNPGSNKSITRRPASLYYRYSDPSIGTNAAVVYREWNWDVMPPDITRPLAKISLGDCVIFAMRLGMAWRVLEPEQGKMSADGNGYSLSSMTVNGVGIVLRFVAAGQHAVKPSVPIEAVDRLLCGVITGDYPFVGGNLSTVGNDRKVISVLQDGTGLYDMIGVSKRIRRAMMEEKFPTMQHEVMILLSPFLPLPQGGDPVLITHPLGKRDPRGVFTGVPGRNNLLEALSDRIGQLEAKPRYPERSLADMREVRDWFTRLRDEAATSHDNRFSAFEYSRKALWRLQFHEHGRDERTHYLHLVAAYVILTFNVSRERNKQGNEDGDEAAQLEIGEAMETNHEDGTDLPRLLADRVNDKKYGIGPYLRTQGWGIRDHVAELGWWLLMLKGAAWSMATREEPFEGEPVPSSFYGSKMPLWIT
ncbi:hypothetical protein F4780DRAFT_739496 [Xylariomycetidae sp. FL0641]|nr:hypothetical protein F4780DRAFT_739496 [Xylariomycetidae sp. FL0641]